jgi:sortase (surface protein transpeptidase)
MKVLHTTKTMFFFFLFLFSFSVNAQNVEETKIDNNQRNNEQNENNIDNNDIEEKKKNIDEKANLNILYSGLAITVIAFSAIGIGSFRKSSGRKRLRL